MTGFKITVKRRHMRNSNRDYGDRKMKFGIMTLTTIIVSLLILATNHAMAQTAPNIPIEVGNGVRDVAYANISLYLNTTDGHYHLKGLVKNLLPETKDDILVFVSFVDRSTGTLLRDVSGTVNGPIAPNAVVPFDVDTGYNTTRANEFQYMKGYIA
jgi:hypothetical protein